MLTVIHADALKHQLRRIHRVNGGRLHKVSDPPLGRIFAKGQTRKIGCFSANFSTPPLIMLVLKVMIPAISMAPQNDIYISMRRMLVLI